MQSMGTEASKRGELSIPHSPQRHEEGCRRMNHSNIATLHGLEESDGVRFLVMELVPGETLRED